MSAQLNSNLSTQLSAHMQFVSSAATVCQLNCQLRRNWSAQLHSVCRVDPLPSLNNILPPKLLAVFLTATNESRVHAVTVH